MSSEFDRTLPISLTISPKHPDLLVGLEIWLQIGLLSEQQIKQICQQHLVCPLPEPAIVPQASSLAENQNDFALVAPPARERRTGVLQSFMAEVSVLWLLFLGVFLVVVSSGVLAASQWRNVPPIGQYGILFTYTLIFWAISEWAHRKSNLQLTARMLQMTTLLIIPVNFWMMDGLKLWSSLSAIGAGIAAIVLTGILAHLLQPQRVALANPRLILVTAIGLSWLHWGWGVPGIPLIATYLGTIGAALVVYQTERRPRLPAEPSPVPPAFLPTVSLGVLAIGFATLLLIGRAVLVARVPIDQLGLALGICGWLLSWLSRREATALSWSRIGAGLLIVGWLMTVTTNPGQAIGVSALGLWLLGDRFFRQPHSTTLIGSFLIGLQTCWLLWRVVPIAGQQAILATVTGWAGTEAMPEALIGVGLFPYVGLTLLGAETLRRQNHLKFATQTEGLALLLGTGLTVISIWNPWVRAVNLLLSLAALAIVVRARSQAGTWLVYLTHAVGLAAIASSLRVGFPNWTATTWLMVLLAGMVAEWLFCLGSCWTVWRRSAWHLGLGLAAIAYMLLPTLEFGGRAQTALLWLAAPSALTGLAYRPNFFVPAIAAWCSTIALLLIQPLTLMTPGPRLVSLAVATGLMVLNTQRLRALAAACLTVGFGLALAATIAWQAIPQWLTLEGWLLFGALAVLFLWLVWSWLLPRSPRWSRLYAHATDGWAIGLSLPLLLLLLAFNLANRVFDTALMPTIGLSAAILAIAYGWRLWGQPRNWNSYGLALSAELWLASLLTRPTHTLASLAIGTLALGLVTQLLGDRKFYRDGLLSSWHVIPLIYAVLGAVLGHHQFTATTGLYTLAASAIGIGVGRRLPSFKPIVILSVLGVSLAAYEGLLYQLSQATGGEAGDGLTLLAGLGIAIAIGQRVFARWLLPYFRLTAVELRTIADLHWGLAIGLSLLAWANWLSPTGGWLWLGVVVILAADALIQGRSRESWTYAGIATAGIAILDLLRRYLPSQMLVDWGAAIAASLAIGLYVLPWVQWGWSARPWKRSAGIIPAIGVALTAWDIPVQGLLMVAAFYAWFARVESQIRLSYLSVVLANWAMLRLLNQWSVREPLWYAALLGGSLLYVAQVDPAVQSTDDRTKRHLLRCLATALICLTALYQAEVGIMGLSAFIAGALAIGISLAFVLAGIALRVRAFLFIGTIAFILQVLRQVQLFISDYAIVLWAVGIVFGSLLIWVALTFEARRSQLIAFVQYWVTELETWE